jgi:hypothetical protein
LKSVVEIVQNHGFSECNVLMPVEATFNKMNKLTSFTANLRVHLRLNHTEVKSIPCSSCSHVSTSKRVAKEHEKIHAGLLCDFYVILMIWSYGLYFEHDIQLSLLP